MATCASSGAASRGNASRPQLDTGFRTVAYVPFAIIKVLMPHAAASLESMTRRAMDAP